MRKYLISLVSGAALLTTGGTAWAEEGDYIGNFEGFYAGVLVGFAPAGNDNRHHVGAFGGYRWALYNSFVVGSEAQATLGLDRFNFQFVDASISGQAGVVVGRNILLYAKAGLAAETYLGLPRATYVPLLGAGAELAVNDNVNLRFEVVAELNYPFVPNVPVRGAEFNFGVIANLN